MENKTVAIIRYHIANKFLMTVVRIFNSEKNVIEGFPLVLSENLLLMTVINDFHDEGYAIIRLCDISDAYSKESDSYIERICIAEGLQSKSIPEYIKDLSDVKIVLKQIRDYKGLIAIQSENQMQKSAFYLGQIAGVYDSYIVFKDLDMQGRWDEEINKIYFDEITQISFEDNYSKLFYKYLNKT